MVKFLTDIVNACRHLLPDWLKNRLRPSSPRPVSPPVKIEEPEADEPLHGRLDVKECGPT